MRWNGSIRAGVVFFALAGCVGSGGSPTAAAPTKETGGSTSSEADGEGVSGQDESSKDELVRAADLPGHPSGAVGFTFGEEASKAESSCVGGGHGWRKVDGEIYHCDGLPDAPELQGTVFVQTCGGQVCLLRVILNPPQSDETAWLPLHDKVLQMLIDDHGEPWQRTNKLPKRCEGEELESCLRDGDAELQTTWQWPGGHKVELRLVPPAKGRSIALHLTYSTGGS